MEWVDSVLQGKHLFARLGLEAEVVDPSVVRKQYRVVALAVHPDKCAHPKAKEAFQRLSEAFEELSSESGQRKYLQLLRCQHGKETTSLVRHHRKKRRKPTDDFNIDEDRKKAWWDTRTWEEFEERLRRREACEAALRKHFCEGQRTRHLLWKLRTQIIDAERSVEHCDMQAGLDESDLWPPPPPPPPPPLETPLPVNALPMTEERVELEDVDFASERLVRLLTHLRTVHRYCLFCGCTYDSDADMAESCPGFTEQEHDEAQQVAMRGGNGRTSTLDAADSVAAAAAAAMPLPSEAAAARRAKAREEAAARKAAELAAQIEDPLEALWSKPASKRMRRT
mmetsp:Transcript_43780/g.103460  ORF Transcript_43780/g.103460 Transcript_43780/m.103460 type:complete len:339 (+) Transcript_43780:60-1076(+)